MSKKRTGLGVILKVIARGPERSPLFYYLYDNHDDIVRAAIGRRIRWEPLAASLKDFALLDGAGGLPTAQTVRKTWWKVRKEILKHRTLRSTGMLPRSAVKPKRPPADWLPPALAQSNAPPRLEGVHRDGHSAALPPALPRQPEPPAPAGASQDSSRPAPGSIEAARQTANLRSGLKANGDPLYKR
jgi:hypothetical protein